MKKQYLLIGLALVALIAVSVALAQDKLVAAAPAAVRAGVSAGLTDASVPDSVQPDPAYSLETDGTFATVDLEAGFVLDPYILRVLGGGDTEASTLDETCAGFIDANPNAKLNWSGESDKLSIFVYSDSDPVLAVETPAGDYVCSDDAGQIVLDPVVTLENPATGSYNIHVGAFAEDEFVMGFLVITELDVEDELVGLDLAPMLDRRDHPDEALPPVADLSHLLLNERAIFGTMDLSPGFETVTLPAVAGGHVPVHALDDKETDCAGFVSVVPSYSFDWTGFGNASVFFEAEENTTLVVVTPRGDAICTDNAAEGNLNPALDLRGVIGGQYDIYIGSYDPTTVIPGMLTITEDLGTEPATLSPVSE